MLRRRLESPTWCLWSLLTESRSAPLTASISIEFSSNTSIGVSPSTSASCTGGNSSPRRRERRRTRPPWYWYEAVVAALERSYGAKPALLPALFSLDAPLAPPFAEPGDDHAVRVVEPRRRARAPADARARDPPIGLASVRSASAAISTTPGFSFGLNPWPNTAPGARSHRGGDRRRSRRSALWRSVPPPPPASEPSDDEAFPSPPPSLSRAGIPPPPFPPPAFIASRVAATPEGDAIAGSDASGPRSHASAAPKRAAPAAGARRGGRVEGGGGVRRVRADPSVASAKAPTGSLAKSEKSRGELTYPANRGRASSWPFARVIRC